MACQPAAWGNTHTLSYTVEYKRCSRIRLMALDDDSLHIVAPVGMSRKNLEASLHSCVPAVWHRLHSAPRQCRSKRLKPAMTVTLLGTPLALQVQHGSCHYEIADGMLQVYVPDPYDLRQVMQTVIEALQASLKRVTPAIQHTRCSVLKVDPPRVRYQIMQTRWGSCRSNGSITLNAWLGGAPIDVIDYVVTHELCHLKVPNHSRSFWDLVEQVVPDYRIHRDWLKRYGPSLVYIGPA